MLLPLVCRRLAQTVSCVLATCRRSKQQDEGQQQHCRGKETTPKTGTCPCVLAASWHAGWNDGCAGVVTKCRATHLRQKQRQKHCTASRCRRW
jgi:hypothetical protein